MYFWDVKALVEDFKEKRVTQRERLKYFLIFIGLCSVEAGFYFLNYIDVTANYHSRYYSLL